MSLHLSAIRKWLVQSPPGEWVISTIRDLVIRALSQGPIPQHVAFVMDGNRRFARQHQIETVEGHNLGFEALARILEVCYKTGVKVVTIYAFSIENFKRPKFEVDALMDMAKVKLSQLAQHGELLDRYGASVRILGQRELIKPDVLEAIDEAVNLTKHNKRAVLNVCFPYTSRDEITTAIRTTVAEYSRPLPPYLSKRPFSESHITRNIRYRQLSTLREESTSRSNTPEPYQLRPPTTDVAASSSSSSEQDASELLNSNSSLLTNKSVSTSGSEQSSTFSHNASVASTQPSEPAASAAPEPPHTFYSYPDPETITDATITSHTFFSAASPPLDLLIRTSGVERLSDFMLWQCHEHTSIVFLDCMWPEFDLWQFLPVLVEWQWWRRKGRDMAAEEDDSHELELSAAQSQDEHDGAAAAAADGRRAKGRTTQVAVS